jgi:Ca-activated chloride channel family protein
LHTEIGQQELSYQLYFFPTALAGLLRRAMGMELRHQYVSGYRPSNEVHDFRWRKIKIKLRPPRGFPP